MRFVLALALLAAAPQEGPKAGLAVWDTGKPSAQPYAAEAIRQKAGWAAVGRDQTPGSFKGDAVFTNGRILAVLRQADGTVELFALRGEEAISRARLVFQGQGASPAVKLEKAAVAENSRAAAVLEATFKTAKGGTLPVKLKLAKGEVFLETQPGAGVERLRVESPGRFVVLPDFFADDMVVDARQVPGAVAEVPSENFLLHLAGTGDAITMVVFEKRDQDVKVTLTGEGAARTITGSDLELGKDRKAWVAVLDGPSMWHARDLERKDVGRVTPLEWTMPFPALWRVDFTRTDELNDSWEMIYQEKEGAEFIKPVWFGNGPQKIRPNRQHFDQAIGGLLYPAWTDPQRKGYVQPFNEKGKMEITFKGPMVLYPINRLAETSRDTFTVVDVVRSTLGVGPCEYILDVEGQKEELKGRATCSVREELKVIYQKGEQKSRRADIERFLQQGLTFVTHIRSRITGYVDFSHKMGEAVAAERKAHPELGPALDPIDKLLKEVDERVAAKMEKIKTPAYVAKMNEEFRKTILDAEGPQALERCTKYWEELVDIGGTQDELVGECRWLVKNLRQRVGLMAVKDGRLADVCGRIRIAAQEVLRSPSVHEKARH